MKALRTNLWQVSDRHPGSDNAKALCVLNHFNRCSKPHGQGVGRAAVKLFDFGQKRRQFAAFPGIAQSGITVRRMNATQNAPHFPACVVDITHALRGFKEEFIPLRPGQTVGFYREKEWKNRLYRAA